MSNQEQKVGKTRQKTSSSAVKSATPSKGTPTPWKLRQYEDHIHGVKLCFIEDPTTVIAELGAWDYPGCSNTKAKANAEFIVKACNNHHSLLTACKAALRDLEMAMFTSYLNGSLEVAIAKAEA